jgi:hypothetical protein
VKNLGKPLNQYRIRGLVYAPNGKLYGAGGDDDEMVRLFSYDPVTGGYELLGFLDVNRRPLLFLARLPRRCDGRRRRRNHIHRAGRADFEVVSVLPVIGRLRG